MTFDEILDAFALTPKNTATGRASPHGTVAGDERAPRARRRIVKIVQSLPWADGFRITWPESAPTDVGLSAARHVGFDGILRGQMTARA